MTDRDAPGAAPAKPPLRAPQVFEVGEATIEPAAAARAAKADRPASGEVRVAPTPDELRRGIRWGALLFSAIAGLAGLAAGLAFGRFVSAAFERDDWVGWLATGLGLTAVVATFVLMLREIAGLFRLGRLQALNEAVAAALARQDMKAEQTAVAELQRLLGHRADCRWGLARLAEHAGDGRDPGDLLRLADREVMAPLDDQARRQILKSSKRVATVSAISPMTSVAMLFVAFENLRMLRTLATIYGGRPGLTGTLRLARLVIGHIVATGGVAMTDDLIGQFLGQDLLRRLSRRLGEAAFNGALTARVGVAALTVTRPLPFLEVPEIRVRDLVPEIFRKIKAAGETGAASRPVS
jgi:putative membrane protein